MTDYTTGGAGLRKEFVDSAVKAVALMSYKLKTLCDVQSSNSWQESYYRETNSDPSGGTTALSTFAVKGIPRLAPFPYGEVTETKVASYIDKYGMEAMISIEDIKMDIVPILQRTILRIGRAVAKAVDSQIAAVMLASAGNTFALSAGYEWDATIEAQRQPIYDILFGIDMLRKDNLDALDGNGFLVVNGTDYTNLISNSKILNNPSFKIASDVQNGVVGEICGLKIMVTEALEVTTPDVAYIVMAKEAMVWKEATPLTVVQIEDPGIKVTLRAYEHGVCQMVAPNGVCKITNTRK